MKITFFGTADGIPRPGHFRASTMVEVGERLYLVDAGAPVIDLMLEHGQHPDRLKAFFNTHSHEDHIAGLLPLIMLCGWAYRDARFDLYVPEACVAKAFTAFREALVSEFRPCDRLQFHVFEEGVIYDDGVMKVTAIATAHCRPHPSYAFLLEAEGKRVLLSGDLSHSLEDFPQIVGEEELDLFVCEMAHFGEEEIAPHLETCKAKRVMFNHYQQRKEAHIEALASPGRFPFPISMAQDGDVVEL